MKQKGQALAPAERSPRLPALLRAERILPVSKNRNAECFPDLKAYVVDVSYYSGKLEAYLRYKEIPYERIEVGARQLTSKLGQDTGEARVPAVELGDGRFFTDSTPIIEWFERHAEGPAIISADPYQAFFMRLLEDYADEWLWRPAMHYRWSYREDRTLLGSRIANEVAFDVPLPHFVLRNFFRLRQFAIYVWGDGVRRDTRAHVESIYLGTLDRLTDLLIDHPFLFGERPSLADFGFFASMFRHFATDPTPARIMRKRAPLVYEWVARLWAARASSADGPFVPAGTLPNAIGPLLRDIGRDYLPYLAVNAEAYSMNARRFDHPVGGVVYRHQRTDRYRVWCRERLHEHFKALPDEVQTRAEETLREHGCQESVWRDEPIASNYAPKGRPPLD